MFDTIKNYMILRNEDTPEEHVGKVIEVEKGTRKIKLQLVDDNKNLYYRGNKEIEVIMPKEVELYCFKSFVIYFDVLDRIITIEYPAELNKIIKRGHKRYDINIPVEIEVNAHKVPSISFDLGLGGIGLLVNSSYELNEEVVIRIKTEKLINEEFKLRVLNKKDFKYKGKDYLLYGGEFINIKKEAFDKLILFLNEKNTGNVATQQA